jgi:alcohol dehydrogenase class IV
MKTGRRKSMETIDRFDFHLPTRILFGRGQVGDIGSQIPPEARRVFVVTDRGVATRTPALDAVRRGLAGRDVLVFDGVEENPSLATVEAGIKEARDFGAQFVVGLGGGSPMDAAKGVALAAVHDGDIRGLLAGDKPSSPALPVIAIPTTSGTGSEVTPYAVFTDTRAGNKVGYGHPSIFPAVAIVDPELAAGMPETVALNTGLDVLAHAVEAYLSTIASPLSDTLALEAAEAVLAHLSAAIRKVPGSVDRMSYAAMLAGVAITHGSTILPHIMGYPLTMFHGVPHGRASAVLLAPVLDFIRRAGRIPDRIREIDRLFAQHGGITAFLSGLGVPTKLSDYGLREDQVLAFAHKTIVKGDVRITPAEVTVEDLAEIYRSAL